MPILLAYFALYRKNLLAKLGILISLIPILLQILNQTVKGFIFLVEHYPKYLHLNVDTKITKLFLVTLCVFVLGVSSPSLWEHPVLKLLDHVQYI